MAMSAIRERAATGPQAEQRAEPPAPVIEHPSAPVIRFWGFMITALSEKAWNIANVLLPFAAIGVNAALWWKFMPGLTETQLYGLGVFSAFSLIALWIARK